MGEFLLNFIGYVTRTVFHDMGFDPMHGLGDSPMGAVPGLGTDTELTIEFQSNDSNHELLMWEATVTYKAKGNY